MLLAHHDHRLFVVQRDQVQAIPVDGKPDQAHLQVAGPQQRDPVLIADRNQHQWGVGHAVRPDPGPLVRHHPGDEPDAEGAARAGHADSVGARVTWESDKAGVPLRQAQLSARVSSGMPRPRCTSSTSFASAVRATRCGTGPYDTRATPSSAILARGSDPGIPISVRRCGPRASTSVLTCRSSSNPGTKTTGAPASRYARPRSTASPSTSAGSRLPALTKASVRAFSTKSGTPSASAAFITASTWAAASVSGFIWSSMLAPTMPTPMAPRMVSGAS